MALDPPLQQQEAPLVDLPPDQEIALISGVARYRAVALAMKNEARALEGLIVAPEAFKGEP